MTEQAEDNKMTASNLGIIFGPTLVKPRQTDAEVSLSSLVDYPYQALMVEQLVRHFTVIFDRTAAAPLSASDLQHNVAGGGGQASPRLTAKDQRLSRHSTSLLDIKEVRAGVCVCVDAVVPIRWSKPCFSFFLDIGNPRIHTHVLVMCRCGTP